MKANAINPKTQTVNRVLVVTLHVIAAGIFIILPLMFVGPRSTDRPGPRRTETFRLPPDSDVRGPQINDLDFRSMRLHSVLFNVILIGFFYVNMYMLVPRVLTRKSWIYYAGSVLLCFGVMLMLNELVAYAFFSGGFRPGRPIYFTIINFLLVFGLSTALRLTSDRVEFERDRKEREHENLKSELSMLRSQVSPHFMFNVLNNLASLARKKSDNLESVIIQLSQLMRYMLYDSGEKKVSLEKEIEYLRSYIDLQKLRFGNDMTVRFSADVKLVDIPIEPMLFIPFVENAFKHGAGMIADPVIEISLNADDNALYFSVKNKFTAVSQSKDPSSGIGIQNVRRRLDLLYKDMHELRIKEVDHWFIAELKLILK